MCYYNGVRITKSQSIQLQKIEKPVAAVNFLQQPLQSGFDYPLLPVLKKSAGGLDFDLVQMEWGFLPPFIKSREQAHQFRMGYQKQNGLWQEGLITLNARSEEMLAANKMYREAALHRRCLILSTGFYEWRHVFPIGKRTGKPLKTAIKYPYRVKVKNSEYFFMAGIYTPWHDHITGESVETCSILTTGANQLMEQIHNTKKRMPTILPEAMAWDWLMEDLDEEQIAVIASFKFPAQQMEAYSIDKNFRTAPVPELPVDYGLEEVK